MNEYKTKSPEVSLALFMQRWEMGMQGSFQILALEEELRKQGKGGVVQGILVNVLEKPKRYVPKRKCKGCQEYYEYALWLPTGDGQYSCPVCGAKQVLQALKENPVTRPPAYYRILATRTKEQLDRARREILVVGERMERMASKGLYGEPWNVENCVQYRRGCGYFRNHLNGTSTLDDMGMQDVKEYRGLEEG